MPPGYADPNRCEMIVRGLGVIAFLIVAPLLSLAVWRLLKVIVEARRVNRKAGSAKRCANLDSWVFAIRILQANPRPSMLTARVALNAARAFHGGYGRLLWSTVKYETRIRAVFMWQEIQLGFRLRVLRQGWHEITASMYAGQCSCAVLRECGRIERGMCDEVLE